MAYRFPETTFLSVHPGVVAGRLYRHTNRFFRFLINSFMAPYLRYDLLAPMLLETNLKLHV